MRRLMLDKLNPANAKQAFADAVGRYDSGLLKGLLDTLLFPGVQAPHIQQTSGTNPCTIWSRLIRKVR